LPDFEPSKNAFNLDIANLTYGTLENDNDLTGWDFAS